MSNINVVALTGNLTRAPELRDAGGTSVTTLRMAVNERVKQDDVWSDRANYFDVTVWGGSAEACCKYLGKGSAIAVQGRLRWREWTAKDGAARQSVDVVASAVQFPPRDSAPARPAEPAPVPEEEKFSEPVGGKPASGATDDVPF